MAIPVLCIIDICGPPHEPNTQWVLMHDTKYETWNLKYSPANNSLDASLRIKSIPSPWFNKFNNRKSTRQSHEIQFLKKLNFPWIFFSTGICANIRRQWFIHESAHDTLMKNWFDKLNFRWCEAQAMSLSQHSIDPITWLCDEKKAASLWKQIRYLTWRTKYF